MERIENKKRAKLRKERAGVGAIQHYAANTPIARP